jgi:hypothetical protein
VEDLEYQEVSLVNTDDLEYGKGPHAPEDRATGTS